MGQAAEIYDSILLLVLVMLRVGALFIFFPVFGQVTISPFVRIAATITLAIALMPVVSGALPQWTINSLPSNGEIFSVALRELAIGAGMGFVARLFFTTCSASAAWVGSQMGFAMAGLFSAENQESESSWSEFHQWMAIMLFLSIGGHLLMLQALVESYQFSLALVADRMLSPAAGTMFWLEMGTQFFFWMLKLAGPVVSVLLLLQVALGVLAKFIPQINVWLVSLPLTLAVGVFVFSVFSPLYGDALTVLFENQLEAQYKWLQFLGGR